MRKGIDKVLGGILAFLMMLMTVDVLYGVFMRYVLNSQPGWTEEIARFSLMWIGILGAAYAAGQNNHLSIDLISEKLNEQNNRRLGIFINILVIIFAGGVLLIGGIRLMYVTSHLGQTSAGLQLPMSLIYSVLPISGFLIVLYKLMDLFAKPQIT